MAKPEVMKNGEKKVFPASKHETQTWPLSLDDLLFPPLNIRWIAFYETDGSSDFMSQERLESSLAKVLDDHPLLAGRLVQLPLGLLQIEYKQEDPQGCLLTFATANFTLASLKQSHFAQKDIPNEIKPGAPLASPTSIFSAQITRLACGSVAMSYALHHKVGDGYSAQTLVEKWSRVARGLQVEKPLLDRSVLSPTSAPLADDHPEYKVLTPADLTAPPPAMGEAARCVFTFSAEKAALLKSTANTGLEAGRWVSTNDCIVTLLWRVITRARGLKAGDTTSCGIAADGRKKWNTSQGDMTQYFGNCIGIPKVTADAGTLLQATLGQSALLLRDQVEKMDVTRFQSTINWIDRVPDKSKIQANFKPFSNDIFVTSWLMFPMYDSDFGWGKPAKALFHAPAREGNSFILPRGPASDVDKNGMEVILGVPAAHADKVLQDPELLQFASVVIDN